MASYLFVSSFPSSPSSSSGSPLPSSAYLPKLYSPSHSLSLTSFSKVKSFHIMSTPIQRNHNFYSSEFTQPDHNISFGNSLGNTSSRGGNQSKSNHHGKVIHEDSLKPILEQNLENISQRASWDDQIITAESGRQTAAAIDLLKLFNTSNPGLEEVGRRASQGAKVLEEGERLVKEGKSMLHTAFKDIPKYLGY